MKVSSIHGSGRAHYGPSPAGKSDGKEFSQTLDREKNQQQQRLGQMLDRIKVVGRRLESSRSMADVSEYKQRIQEYLSYVLGNCYRLRSGGNRYGQWLTWVETVNKDIEELTRTLLEQEKVTINIAARVDKLTGLLVDIYDAYIHS